DAAGRLLDEAFGAPAPPARGAVYLAPRAEGAGDQRAVTGPALSLAQALVARGGERLWLVTRGAQAARAGEPVRPGQAPLWGLARAIAEEHPELRCVAVDLDP